MYGSTGALELTITLLTLRSTVTLDVYVRRLSSSTPPCAGADIGVVTWT